MWNPSARRQTRWRVVRAAAAAMALGATLVLASTGMAVFRSPRPSAGTSLWRMLLSDSATLGFVRLAIIIATLYVISSLVVLASGGRWITALNARGFETEDAWASTEALAQAEAEARAAEQERDEAIRVTEEVLQWLNRP